MYGLREYVEAGGLMSLWAEHSRPAAGAPPCSWTRSSRARSPPTCPVEQPTKFELVINLRTAKALGLTIPPAVLARADEIIQ